MNITLHSGNKREKQIKDQLLRLVDEYPLTNWLFTTDIQIQSVVHPHSHPGADPQHPGDER